MVGDQQAGAQTEEHRDAAEPWRGFPVHVACRICGMAPATIANFRTGPVSRYTAPRP